MQLAVQLEEQLPFERVATNPHPSAFETLVDSAFKSSTGLAHVHMDSTVFPCSDPICGHIFVPARWAKMRATKQNGDRYYRGRFFVVHIFAQQAVT